MSTYRAQAKSRGRRGAAASEAAAAAEAAAIRAEAVEEGALEMGALEAYIEAQHPPAALARELTVSPIPLQPRYLWEICNRIITASLHTSTRSIRPLARPLTAGVSFEASAEAHQCMGCTSTLGFGDGRHSKFACCAALGLTVARRSIRLDRACLNFLHVFLRRSPALATFPCRGPQRLVWLDMVCMTVTLSFSHRLLLTDRSLCPPVLRARTLIRKRSSHHL